MPKALQCVVDVEHRVALLEEPPGFGEVRREDAVDEKTRTIAHDDRQLADALDEAQRRLQRERARAVAAHDLHQLHAVHRIEEVDANHATRIRQLRRQSPSDRERGGIGGQRHFRRGRRREPAKDLLFQIKALDGGLDDEVDAIERHVAGHWHDSIERGARLGLGEAAALDGIAKQFPDRLQSDRERFRCNVLEQHRGSARGEPLRDAGAHHTCADHGHALHLARRRGGRREVGGQAGLLRAFLQKEKADEVARHVARSQLGEGGFLERKSLFEVAAQRRESRPRAP